VPKHKERSNIESIYPDDPGRDPDDENLTLRSNKLYDDSEDDLYNQHKESTFKKSTLQRSVDGQSFGDYIQKQINSYFDHTNVSEITSMA
jgi:hypothetical protein